MPRIIGQDDQFWYWNDDYGTPWTTARNPSTDSMMSQFLPPGEHLGIFSSPEEANEQGKREITAHPTSTPTLGQNLATIITRKIPESMRSFGESFIPSSSPAQELKTIGALLNIPIARMAGQDSRAAYEEFKTRQAALKPEKIKEISQEASKPKPASEKETPTKSPVQPSQGQDDFSQAFGAYEKAIGQQQKAQADIAKAQEDILQIQAEAEQTALNAAQAQLQAQEEERKKWEGIVDQDIQEIRNMNVDPNRLWNSQSTGLKVLATIGMMLGAAGAVYGGTGQNQALRLFENSVEQDIRAQEQNMNKRMNLMRFNYERFQDLDAARSATRIQQYTYAQKQAEIHAMKSSSPLFRKMAEDSIAKMETAKNENRLNIIMSMMKNAGGASENFVPGYGYAPNKFLAKEAVKELSSYDKAIVGLNELKFLRQTYGVEVIPNPVKKRMESLAAATWRELRSGLGQLSQADYKFLEKQVPEKPGRIGFVMAQLDTAIDFLNNKKEATLQSYGLKPKSATPEEMGISKSQRIK